MFRLNENQLHTKDHYYFNFHLNEIPNLTENTKKKKLTKQLKLIFPNRYNSSINHLSVIQTIVYIFVFQLLTSI